MTLSCCSGVGESSPAVKRHGGTPECAGIACKCRLVPGMECGCIGAAYHVAGCYVRSGDSKSGGPGALAVAAQDPAVAVQGPAVAVQGVEGPGCTGVHDIGMG
jgi:hypothetical protein